MAEATGKKRKRIVLAIEEKLKICESIRKGLSMTSVAQQFNVGRSTVHDIVKNEAKLKRFATEIEGGCIKKRNIVRRPEFSEQPCPATMQRFVYLYIANLVLISEQFSYPNTPQSQRVRITDILLYYI